MAWARTLNFVRPNTVNFEDFSIIQDGPSLESSSYLNLSLRYLWTQRPWDSWTLGPLPSSTTSTYLFLLHYPTSFYLFLPPPSLLTPMVWYGGGGLPDDYGPF